MRQKTHHLRYCPFIGDSVEGFTEFDSFFREFFPGGTWEPVWNMLEDRKYVH